MRTDRRGFVIVAVLWLMVALGAVGLDQSLRNRTERLAAANAIDEARARSVALAGAEYARSRLTAALLERADELRSQGRRSRTRSMGRLFGRSDPFEDPWRVPEELVVSEGALGDARFTLRVRDRGALLNVNEVDYESLRSFFALGLRVDAADADAIANAIVDWRDPDDLPWPGGGEREEYLEEGRPVLPANRGFADVEELQFVRGMTPEILAQASPYLTVFGSDDINLNAAPEPVLLAIPGMTEAAAAAIVDLRESGVTPRSDGELFEVLGDALAGPLRRQGRDFERRVDFTTSEVEILSRGWIEGSPVSVVARTVVTRSDDGALVIWEAVR